MLEELRRLRANVANEERNAMRNAYARAMTLALAVGDNFNDLMTQEAAQLLRQRLHQYAVAAQELAYAYRLHHGIPLANEAIDADRYDHRPIVEGMSRSVLEGKDLKEAIQRYLVENHPHTVPR